MYTSSVNLANVDELLTIMKDCLVSSGWGHFSINTSSARPDNRLIGRQDVYKINGTSADPSSGYLTIYRATMASAAYTRIGAMVFSGGYTSSLPISYITYSGGTNFIEVTCSVPHGLSTDDHVVINGTTNTGSFHDGWYDYDGGLDGRGGYSIIVDGTSSFKYLKPTGSPFSLAAGESSTGSVLVVYNNAGSVSSKSTAENILGIVLNDFTMSCYIYCDEYRICGIVEQLNIFQPFYYGESGREHMPSAQRSRAFLNEDANGSGSVTASLDRNVDNLQVGQDVWFIHPSGTAGTGSFEKTIITSRPNSSSFGCIISGSYPSGSLVGLDPLPLMLFAPAGKSTPTNGSGFVNDKILTIFNMDCSRSPATPAHSQVHIPRMERQATSTRLTDANGTYIGKDVVAANDYSPIPGERGKLTGLMTFPLQTTNGSIVNCGKIPDSSYVIFDKWITGVSGFYGAIGPGAINSGSAVFSGSTMAAENHYPGTFIKYTGETCATTSCPDCATPLSISVTPTSNTNVRVTFSSAVTNNFVLTSTSSYVFTPSLNVTAVTPNSASNPTQVDLTVSGMNNQSYSLSILTIEAS